MIYRPGVRKKDRREFLRMCGGVAVGLPVAAFVSMPGGKSCWSEEKEASKQLRIKDYRQLGNTGIAVSDIGIGTGAISDPAVLQYALDCGINFFDTAEGYARGRSETVIGKVAAKHRQRMVICTKFGMDGTTKVDDMINRLEGCLKRLQTDYSDILMIHGAVKEAIANDDIFTGFDRLKKEGKIKFSGASNHGPDIVTTLSPLIEQKRVDVILCSLDPFAEPELPAFLKAADEKGIGLVAMKVFQAARKAKLEDFETRRLPFHQAALTWALRFPEVDTVLATMNIMDQIDSYTSVSGSGKKQS